MTTCWLELARNATWFALVLLAATPALFAAETPTQKQIEDAIKASITFVDGQSNPERVPEHIRCQAFFNSYGDPGMGYQAELKAALTPEEQTILLNYSQQAKNDWKIEDDLYRRAWMEVAGRADAMNGLELAIEIKKASDESESRQRERCNSPLRFLTSKARKAVNDLAYARIRPQVMMDDPVIIATALPEYYKRSIAAALEYERTGKLPPEVKPAESQFPLELPGRQVNWLLSSWLRW